MTDAPKIVAPQPQRFRVCSLGFGHQLLRTGRVLFDAAAFGLVAPLALVALFFTMFEILFALNWSATWAAGALGHKQFAEAINVVGHVSGLDLRMAFGLAGFIAALVAGAGVAALIVGAARAGRFWAPPLLLVVAGLIAMIGAMPIAPPPVTLTLEVLGYGFRYALPALIAAAALLVLAGATARASAPIGLRVHTWPRFSIPLYVARFGLTRPLFWLVFLGRFLLFALKVTAMAVGFLGLLIGGGLLARAALLRVGFAPELLQFYALMVGINIFLFTGIGVIGVVSMCRNQATRLADLAVLAVCGVALWDMFQAVVFAQRLSSETGAPFFATPMSEGELETLNFIGMVWLFRGFMAGAFLKEYRGLKRQTARTARDLADRRPEKPVLFLRSFDDDEQRTPSSEALLAHAFGGARPTTRLEELVADVMFARGPLVALANPNAKAAPIGAARDIVANEDWQARVLSYLEACQIVVCFFGKTSSFLWEIDQILAKDKLHALMIILPPNYPGDRALIRHAPKLAALLGLADEGDERTRLRNVRVLVYDTKDGVFEAIGSPHADSFAYHEAIVRGGARILENARSAAGRHKAVSAR